MNLERKLVDPVALLLLATWRKKRRWLLWVERKVRQINVRKPMHALVIGSIIGGLAAQVFDYLHTESLYRLQDYQTKVMTHATDQLGQKLTYDKSADAVYFNKDGQDPAGDDTAMTKVGSGGDKELYSAKMPTKAGGGIKVTDTQHQVSATMTPQYALMDGRKVGDRVLYPIQNDSGVLALTPKGNGTVKQVLVGVRSVTACSMITSCSSTMDWRRR